jgi:hypothetical protein
VAQMRSAHRVRKCLLLGVDQTYRGHHETDAFDPKRTSCDVRLRAAIRGIAYISAPGRPRRRYSLLGEGSTVS